MWVVLSTVQFSPHGPSPAPSGPRCCTQTEDAFYCGYVELCQKLSRESNPFELPEEEEPLLGLLHQVGCMWGPSEIGCNADAQEFDVVHPLHLFP